MAAMAGNVNGAGVRTICERTTPSANNAPHAHHPSDAVARIDCHLLLRRRRASISDAPLPLPRRPRLARLDRPLDEADARHWSSTGRFVHPTGRENHSHARAARRESGVTAPAEMTGMM